VLAAAEKRVGLFLVQAKEMIKILHLLTYFAIVFCCISCSTSIYRANAIDELKGKGYIGDFYHDGENRRHSTIIILGGSGGGIPWRGTSGKQHIQELVDLDYAVLALAYYKIEGLPQSLQNIPLEYFESAMSWLSTNPKVVRNHYAVIRCPRISRAVSVYLCSRY